VSRLLAIVAAVVTLAVTAACQKPESAPSTRGKLDVTYEKNNVIYLIGVTSGVQIGDLEIRCENAVIWLADEGSPTESKPIGAETRRKDIMVGFGLRVKELYAEGNVHLRQGEEVHDCDSAFIDFVHERGLVVDPRSRFPIPSPTGQPAKLHVKADELRMFSETNLQLVGAQVSTCPFGNPHYHVASETVDVFRARASRNPPPGQPEGQTPNFYYTATGNTLYTGSGFPVLWLPDFSGDSSSPMGRTYRYLKDVRIGKSNQFGYQFGLSIGDDLKTKEGKKWGSWVADLDYRSKRGPGVGVDFAYEQSCFKGEIKANYQHDVGTDEIYGKPPSEQRWRLLWRNRWFVAKDFQLDLETHLFSDRGYYPTYFEDEYKSDKPPETYAYLKRTFETSAFTGLFLVRGNAFETTTEYRPRLEYVLVTDPIANVFDNPLYFTARAEISRPRRLFDEDLHAPSVDTLRADLDTLVEYPFMAGPVKVTPFAGLRTTYYEYDLARNLHNERNGITWGAEVSMQLKRDYACCGGPLDLDGLRHVVVPSIEYRRTSGVTLHPEELFQYDGVDEFDDEEIVTFGLRNVLQTVRHRKGKPASVDEVLDLNLEMSYFADPDRNNGGEQWSNLFGDAILRLSDELQFLAEFEWDPNESDLEVLDFAVGWTPSDKLQTYAGLHHFEDTYDLVYAQASWQASEKWLVRGYASYDFHRHDWSKTDLAISRLGHDWVWTVIFGANFDRNDFSFSIGLEPRFLFDPILRPHGLRRQPEFQYLGSQLIK
jgi:hypothetical protein